MNIHPPCVWPCDRGVFRFSRNVRTICSLVYIFRTLVYLSIVLYAPTVALGTMTRLPSWATILLIGGVATAYTVKVHLVAACLSKWISYLM